MVWSKAERTDEHAARSASLSAAYDKRGRSGSELMRRMAEGMGSRGGAPIWVMRNAEPHVTIRFKGSACNTCGSNRHLSSQHEASAEPDGFAVYGRYPNGWLAHVFKCRLLGDVARSEVLHVCSGTLSESETWTVDLRSEARPRVQASGTALPFRDGCFRAVMLDPPYSDEYARNLYKTENPRPSWLLKEAARVVVPGGRVGILHVAVPFSPPACRLVNVYGVSTGVGFRIRAFTVYEKRHAELAL